MFSVNKLKQIIGYSSIFVFKLSIDHSPVNVIFILIAVSLLVAIGFLVSFIWSIRAGQYEDEYTPSVRILFDDETNVIPEEEPSAVSGQRSAVSGQQSIDQKANSKPKNNK